MLTYVCFLVIISVSGGNAAIHSLMYTYLATSGIEDVPEFMTVGFLDGVPLVYYDSNIYRVIPRQKWMNMAVESDYWDKETQISIRFQELYKININTAKERFNQTEGVHTYQVMYGCEWDDETNDTNGFHQEGFDGVDLLSLDLKEMRFISLVPEGIPTQNKWNNDSAWLENLRFYFSDLCIGWLKKYLQYGWSSLKKTGPCGGTVTHLNPGGRGQVSVASASETVNPCILSCGLLCMTPRRLTACGGSCYSPRSTHNLPRALLRARTTHRDHEEVTPCDSTLPSNQANLVA
ncbi:class I histocompatibility antigen, F10 alpha chain-like isoform X4 [Myxocyprinus asiaticus]|uniref:class I histocompatibility antigen, F10 alpha chain-like isoform X4 n=1 Tax=Myxocyprinus asiaticus TaxID=70543 RepID=UPI002222FB80|nr:class I histocompatibility antigen, F10 alpha chain-like isoform X4 [Myxocyprinus asiaticus]